VRQARATVTDFLKELSVTLAIMLLVVVVSLIASIISAAVIAFPLYLLLGGLFPASQDSLSAAYLGITFGFPAVGPFLTMEFFFNLLAEKPKKKKKKRKRKPKHTRLEYS
jgi:hypothetical protein